MVTTLKNGLQIVSENKPGHFSVVGVYVDSGSRYETQETIGYSYVLDRMSFKATKRFNSELIKEKIEELGGSISSFATKECMMYQAAIFPEDVGKTVELLGEAVLKPKFLKEDLEETLLGIPWELEDIKSKDEIYLPELFHSVAYSNKTLGNNILELLRNIETITTETLNEYHKKWYTPDRIVIAAVGVEHDKFVELCKKAGFGEEPCSDQASALIETEVDANKGHKSTKFSFRDILFKKTENINPVSSMDVPVLSKLKANYTGGTLFVPDPAAEFTSLYLGFESSGIFDEKKLYAYATLQMLLGGGGSFSAGGPGKGMYSRLYTRVLNQCSWAESCVAFHHCYNDTGLFGISASCHPGSEHAMLETVIKEFFAVANLSSTKNQFVNTGSSSSNGSFTLSGYGPWSTSGQSLTNIEVSRAKNMLKSSLLMNIESRAVQLEDLGRQIQVLGKKISPEEVVAKIDEVTAEDLNQVAAELLTKPATVLAVGQVKGLENFALKMLQSYGLTTF
ncbi:Mitochondrial-processing peptidase subunit alpha [Zancudomyces culisetae]|uniref:Mitochondrial-processing peptidase subunit alpha n=1 Tax=Zancudomyces culisetae TaxID=1213189 RepID=A0A1R1PNW7_ZANCU|nr:Mitochondrial-processing peptidase subunit alpha [Zancudomyces culisetae]|eukprot:OMH82657.1 Mitochondrial-processing peptidase subunit alpha [Zancudomyces culisetae]